MLRRFIGDEPVSEPWEWDDFISVRAAPELEPYRQRLLKEVDQFLGRDEKRAEIDRSLREVISELETAA
jgi:hypothetical protein